MKTLTQREKNLKQTMDYKTMKNDSFRCRESWSSFTAPTGTPRSFHWAYRNKDGKLHSGETRTLDVAIEEAKKYGYKP